MSASREEVNSGIGEPIACLRMRGNYKAYYINWSRAIIDPRFSAALTGSCQTLAWAVNQIEKLKLTTIFGVYIQKKSRNIILPLSSNIRKYQIQHLS